MYRHEFRNVNTIEFLYLNLEMMDWVHVFCKYQFFFVKYNHVCSKYASDYVGGGLYD